MCACDALVAAEIVLAVLVEDFICVVIVDDDDGSFWRKLPALLFSYFLITTFRLIHNDCLLFVIMRFAQLRSESCS